MQAVSFELAKLVLEKYFRDDAGHTKVWLFPQLLRISREWMERCLVLKDDVFPQLLLVKEFAHDAADRIYRAVVLSAEGEKSLMPILDPYEPWGSSRPVDFDTTRPVYPTDPAKCHLSHVVADTNSWEQKMAQALEAMPEVVCYAKNFKLGFAIPYTVDGTEHNYYPDFVASVDDGHGRDDHLHLIVEVTGERKKDKAAKVSTAKTLWIPAVNNHGGFGRWMFVEIDDPWNAKFAIRAALKGAPGVLFARRVGG
jgi:type III restriction enzyme